MKGRPGKKEKETSSQINETQGTDNTQQREVIFPTPNLVERNISTNNNESHDNLVKD